MLRSLEGPDLFRLVVADGSTEAVEPFESLLFWWADPNSVRVGTEMLASQSWGLRYNVRTLALHRPTNLACNVHPQAPRRQNSAANVE